MKVLSIQSSVAYGHVGNSAAAFPLQRLGHEVWPVSTVHFSNHTGYPTSRGPRISAHDVSDILLGIEDRGAFAECDAVLSGYAGTREVLEVIVAAVGRVRRANPAVVFCCDPVLGDTEQGFFVGPGIPEFLRDVVAPAADVITPNHFELDFLAGRSTRTLE